MGKIQCEFVDARAEDRDDYIRLSKAFYQTDSVLHSVPEEHFADAFAFLMADTPYLRCIMIQYEEKNIGYAMLALMHSVEAGGIVVWADELYIDPAYQRQGIGSTFLQYLDQEYKGQAKRIRLEAVPTKEHLIQLYKKNGYDFLGYTQMYKELEDGE